MGDSYSIPTSKILERLRFENPWWRTGQITPEIEEMHRRLYFSLFFPLVEDVSIRRALILMGPRRVGKTVMMHHAISELLGKEVQAQAIQFIGIDNPIYINMSLEELLIAAGQASGYEDMEDRFVFFRNV